jgi:hypothetical protein
VAKILRDDLMFDRKVIFFLCLGLLVLSLPGNASQAVPNTPTDPPANTKSNTLTNTVQIDDIHDIKKLEKYGINPAMFWYGVLGFIIVVLAAVILMYWKKQKKTILEVEASISPEEAAMHMLDDLHALMDSDGKAFYFRLSIILREYIRHRFGVGAPEMTTEELLPRIAELELDSRLLQGAREFVRAGDPVKFAEQPAETETMQQHLEFVRSFVTQTTPLSVTVDENKTNDSVLQ